jgi:phosphohistidine phosphatase
LSDIDRPLNERGERDAPEMAHRLKARQIHPQQMLTSPASRALNTCLKFAKVLGFSAGGIIEDKTIYHATADTLLSVVRQIKDVNNSHPVLIFGHNPGLTDFTNDLLNEDIDNIPTTGVVSCHLMIESWADAQPGCGKIEFFDYPKATE